MGNNPEERLYWKEPLHSLGVELERDYGLSAIASRALVQRIGDFLDTFVSDRPGTRSQGQVSYPAVAVGEPAGKPIRYCRTVLVSLTLVHPSDAEVLHDQGSPALRRARLERLCLEAYRQGGVLSLGLGRQPKIARLLVTEILTLVEKTLVATDHMQPGQLLVLAPEKGQGSSWSQGKLEDKRLKAIRLTLIAAEDIEHLSAGESPREVRRQRLLRLIRQANEQGAALSSHQLALMTGMSPSTISRQLREHMRATGEVLPTRGIIEDMGSATTHKKQIIARHLKGESTSEIARATNHTPVSVERYIRRYEQVRELVGHIGEDPLTVARILGCSQRLVSEYLDLIPREEETQALLPEPRAPQGERLHGLL